MRLLLFQQALLRFELADFFQELSIPGRLSDPASAQTKADPLVYIILIGVSLAGPVIRQLFQPFFPDLQVSEEGHFDRRYSPVHAYPAVFVKLWRTTASSLLFLEVFDLLDYCSY